MMHLVLLHKALITVSVEVHHAVGILRHPLETYSCLGLPDIVLGIKRGRRCPPTTIPDWHMQNTLANPRPEPYGEQQAQLYARGLDGPTMALSLLLS